jgi:hypothetical protein
VNVREGLSPGEWCTLLLAAIAKREGKPIEVTEEEILALGSGGGLAGSDIKRDGRTVHVLTWTTLEAGPVMAETLSRAAGCDCPRCLARKEAAH